MQIQWLMKVHLLYPDFEVDHGSNLITGRNVVLRRRKYSLFNQLVCKPHKDAYLSYVWRLVPSQCDRNALLALDANHEVSMTWPINFGVDPLFPVYWKIRRSSLHASADARIPRNDG